MTWTCDDWNKKAYMRWAGARVLLSEGGRSRVELQVQEHHRGATGGDAVNGAMLAYLHDVAQGAAIRSLLGSDVRAFVTLNLNVSYTALMMANKVLLCDGRAVRVGSAVAFGESDFRDERGEVCCHATGTFRILRNRPSRVEK